METLLNCELPAVVKATPLLPSPTFPIPGSSEPSSKENEFPETQEEQPSSLEAKSSSESAMDEISEENVEDTKQPVLYYTPDDEEVVQQEDAKDTIEEIGDASSVPTFNNTVYPGTSYSSLTSAIGGLEKHFIFFLHSELFKNFIVEVFIYLLYVDKKCF